MQSELKRLKRQAYKQHRAVTRSHPVRDRRFQAEKSLWRLFAELDTPDALWRSRLIKSAITAMTNCKDNSPCGLPGCPACAGFLTKLYTERVVKSSIEFVRMSPKWNRVVAITVTADGNHWNGRLADIHGRLESDLLESVIPVLNVMSGVRGLCSHFDANIVDQSLITAKGTSANTAYHEAEFHAHLHGLLALEYSSTRRQNLEDLADRLTTEINARHPGTPLNIHLESMTSTDGSVSTDFTKLAGWTSYSAKARTYIHNAAITRVVRGELLGAKMYWTSGIYAKSLDDIAQLGNELRRVRTLSSAITALVNHLTKALAASRLETIQTLVARTNCQANVLLSLIAEIDASLSERIAADKQFLAQYGPERFHMAWSDCSNEYVLPPSTVNYLAKTWQLKRRLAVLVAALDEPLARMLKLCVKLQRDNMLPCVDLDNATGKLTTLGCSHNCSASLTKFLFIVSVASIVWQARTRLKSSVPADAEHPEDVATLEAVDNLRRQNNLFPSWLPGETLCKLNHQVWWKQAGRMLLTL